MAVVGDLVREIRDLRFERGRPNLEVRMRAGQIVRSGVLDQAFPDFPTQVESRESGVFSFEFIDHMKALAVVLEAAMTAHQLIEGGFSRVAEWRMSEVMGQRDRFSEVFVQSQGARDVTRDGGDFDGVSKPGSKVIA